jgi:hypothetical protein
VGGLDDAGRAQVTRLYLETCVLALQTRRAIETPRTVARTMRDRSKQAAGLWHPVRVDGPLADLILDTFDGLALDRLPRLRPQCRQAATWHPG